MSTPQNPRRLRLFAGVTLLLLVSFAVIALIRLPRGAQSPKKSNPSAAEDPREQVGAAKKNPLAPSTRRDEKYGAIEWDAPLVDPRRLQASIDLAAAYMNRACQKDGRFTYLIHLDPDFEPPKEYNVLRHAGSMYALAMYHQRSPSDETKRVLLLAGDFLRRRCIGPVGGREEMLAVWSHPKLTGGEGPKAAKLGGAGLGLVALTRLEKIKPGSTPLEDLRRLGRFILFMQKEDGSFYSKYIPSQGGVDRNWTSIYYPGEAALGLLMLYELDRSPQWLSAAAKAIAYLAKSQFDSETVIIDHWMLLSMERLLPLYDQLNDPLLKGPSLKGPPLPRRDLLKHAARTCLAIMQGQKLYLNDPEIAGCFTGDGRTSPTATRLEGLLSALNYLPPEERSLRKKILASTEQGIAFLLRCQVQTGAHAGAIPRAIRPLPPDHPQILSNFNERYQEVRIDYVQHPLSAMIEYERLFIPPGK